MKLSKAFIGTVAAVGLAVFSMSAPRASAEELLAPGLMDPTTQEMTEADKYKSEGPWTVGMSFPGLGNTWIVQMITRVIPASYYVASLQTIFLAGDVWSVLLPSMLSMLAVGALFFGITYLKSSKTLD